MTPAISITFGSIITLCCLFPADAAKAKVGEVLDEAALEEKAKGESYPSSQVIGTCTK